MDCSVDLSLLPASSALAVFVCCFRPLVRRAGPYTNVWFTAWSFLLLHYFARLPVNGQGGLRDRLLTLVAESALAVCLCCFLLAASGLHINWPNRILVAEFGLPVLLLSILHASGLHAHFLDLIPVLLLALPAVHLLALSQHRSRFVNHLAIALAVLTVVLTPFVWISPSIITKVVLCALFVGAAYLALTHAPRFTRGSVTVAAGFALWGGACLLQPGGWLGTNPFLIRTLTDLPKLITAAGLVLSLLDEYVGRTESLALHDPLTGLPNRRLFENRLDQAIEESTRTRTPIACFVIDVDNFKYINDTFGHPVGDGLLRALAKRLSWNLGARDMLARTGGDEFTAVLIEAADEYHIRFIAGAMMAAGCVPVAIQDHLIDVRISIGIAVSPQDAGDSAELHKAADDAMYQAKRRGGSVIAFANEEVPQIHAV